MNKWFERATECNPEVIRAAETHFKQTLDILNSLPNLSAPDKRIIKALESTADLCEFVGDAKLAESYRSAVSRFQLYQTTQGDQA